MSLPHAFLTGLNNVSTAKRSNSHISSSICSPCPLFCLLVIHHCPVQFSTFLYSSQFRSPMITIQSRLSTVFNRSRSCVMVSFAYGTLFLPRCGMYDTTIKRLHTGPSSRAYTILDPTHPTSSSRSAILGDRSIATPAAGSGSSPSLVFFDLSLYIHLFSLCCFRTDQQTNL